MQCIECRAEIHEKAKKCKDCGSFQDWRRFFDVGTMVLSLLVALVSVTALSAEKLYSLITGYSSNLLLAGRSASSGKIDLVALNEGGQASAIIYAELEVKDPRAGVAQYQFKLDSGDYIVGARKVRQLRLVPESNINKEHSDWLDEHSQIDWRNSKTPFAAECTLTVSTITNAGMEEISKSATNKFVMAPIPFGYLEKKMKDFYFQIDCEDVFEIPMAFEQFHIESPTADPSVL